MAPSQIPCAKISGIRRGTFGAKAVATSVDLDGHHILVAASDPESLRVALRRLRPERVEPWWDEGLFRPVVLVPDSSVVFEK